MKDRIWNFEVTEFPMKSMSLITHGFNRNKAGMDVWHQRMGHVHEKYLKGLIEKGHVKGMEITDNEIQPCEACHLGKQKRKVTRQITLQFHENLMISSSQILLNLQE